MYEDQRILGIITARGGSKRIPGKNIKPLGGKPLIAWTIEAALASRYVDRCILSSEDEEIIHVASKHGCDVPFVRPAHLATDEATSSDVVLHALNALGEHYDYFVLLQPTSPFRTSEDIDNAVALCLDSGAPSVISVRGVRDKPEWMCALNKAGSLVFPFALPKDRIPPLYILNGAVYVVRVEGFLENSVFRVPETKVLPMPWERSVDIDTEEDWLLAEFLLHKRLNRARGRLERAL